MTINYYFSIYKKKHKDFLAKSLEKSSKFYFFWKIDFV